jgi:hypothetical protein
VFHGRRLRPTGGQDDADQTIVKLVLDIGEVYIVYFSGQWFSQ